MGMMLTVGFSAADVPKVNERAFVASSVNFPVKPDVTRKSKVAAILETAVK